MLWTDDVYYCDFIIHLLGDICINIGRVISVVMCHRHHNVIVVTAICCRPFTLSDLFIDSIHCYCSLMMSLLFSLFVALVSDIAAAHHVSIHQYADGTLPFIQVDLIVFLSWLSICTDDASHWFLENDLLLNPSKTEAVVFGIESRLRSINTSGCITVVGSTLQFSDSVKMLGVKLD